MILTLNKQKRNLKRSKQKRKSNKQKKTKWPIRECGKRRFNSLKKIQSRKRKSTKKNEVKSKMTIKDNAMFNSIIDEHCITTSDLSVSFQFFFTKQIPNSFVFSEQKSNQNPTKKGLNKRKKSN